MRIAFVGKGGSGKTTVSSLFVRFLLKNNISVLAIDADLNQHLADSLGLTVVDLRALGEHQDLIKRQVIGDNKQYDWNDIIKTTPPNAKSWIARSIKEFNDKFPKLFLKEGNLIFSEVGEQSEDDLAIRCYHSKTGVVELLLNHLVECEDEIVVVDMVAGADAFASGLYDKFDLTVIVVEPTKKSVAVYKQYVNQAKRLGVNVKAVGNKVIDDSDIEYLTEELKEDLLGCFPISDFVRKEERGEVLSISDLEECNIEVINNIMNQLNSVQKDWNRYLNRVHEIHLKNAKSWGNASKGKDLESQIDDSFRY